MGHSATREWALLCACLLAATAYVVARSGSWAGGTPTERRAMTALCALTAIALWAIALSAFL